MDIDIGFEVEAGHGGLIAMLMLPDDIGEEIMGWGSKNIPDENIYKASGHGREKSPHITIQNGLLAEDPHEIEKVLSAFGPIDVKFGRVSHFANLEKPYDVVKISIDSSDLEQLNRHIRANIEVNDPFGKFNPHATIAYVGKGLGSKYHGNAHFLGKKALANRVVIAGKGSKEKSIKLSPKKVEPLKESLDYGSPNENLAFATQDLEGYLLDTRQSIKDINQKKAVAIIDSLRKTFVE